MAVMLTSMCNPYCYNALLPHQRACWRDYWLRRLVCAAACRGTCKVYGTVCCADAHFLTHSSLATARTASSAPASCPPLLTPSQHRCYCCDTARWYYASSLRSAGSTRSRGSQWATATCTPTTACALQSSSTWTRTRGRGASACPDSHHCHLAAVTAARGILILRTPIAE